MHYEEAGPCSCFSVWPFLICRFLLLVWHVADPGKSVMSARFRLPAGRSYNVRATELERDRQHTQVVCNVLLLDNTVQAFKVSVSTRLILLLLRQKAPSDSSNQGFHLPVKLRPLSIHANKCLLICGQESAILMAWMVYSFVHSGVALFSTCNKALIFWPT